MSVQLSETLNFTPVGRCEQAVLWRAVVVIHPIIVIDISFDANIAGRGKPAESALEAAAVPVGGLLRLRQHTTLRLAPLLPVRAPRLHGTL